MASEGKYESKQDQTTETRYRVRTSLRELGNDPVKLNAFLRAFKRIKELPVSDPNSFWVIAGYHGEPFTGERWKVDGNSWGGYCQHANVLFPTWHRAYCLRLEDALRSQMEPGDDVTLPYWDYTSPEALSQGIPEILTDAYATIDGVEVPNPILSYTFQQEISSATGDDYYQKPDGYTTVRYPYSGILSPELNKKLTDIHNAKTDAYLKSIDRTATDALNSNLFSWMVGKNMVYAKFKYCLKAPDYTTFSNTESAGGTLHVALETPHNDVHLAVGGYTAPFSPKSDTLTESARTWKPVENMVGANGDMGENETAAFDPSFFFHHCNIDRVFWIWQKNNNATTTLEIIAGNKGAVTSSRPRTKHNADVDIGTGPTAGQSYDEQLTVKTPLIPFTDPTNDQNYLTSEMVADIKNQLGYDYSVGSFDTPIVQPAEKLVTRSFSITSEAEPVSALKNKITGLSNETGNISYVIDITGCDDEKIYNAIVGEEQQPEQARVFRTDFVKASMVNKAWFPGSFVLRAWYTPPGAKDKILIGLEGILDRWNAGTCANCQLHRIRNVTFSLAGFGPIQQKNVTFDIVSHDMVNGGQLIRDVSIDDSNDVQISSVKFYAVLTKPNKNQASDSSDGRPVAWEEVQLAEGCCTVL